MENPSIPGFISGVAFRFLRRSGSRVSIRNPVRRNGCLHTESLEKLYAPSDNQKKP